MIAQDILYNARALVDEYNIDGVVISSDTDYIKALEANGIRYINMGLREIYKDSKYFKSFEISNDRIPNLLGEQFNKVDFTGVDKNYPESENGVVGAKAYYFEVDSDATVYIEEYSGTWDTLETINIVTSVPSRNKGVITPTDDSYPIRMRFSGTTFYRHQNRCLFPYSFKVIPDYRAWIPVVMPDDFAEINEVICEKPVRQYGQDPDYKQEGFNELYINYFFDGNLRVVYSVQVTEVTASTDTVLLPNPIAIEFLNNFVAARSAMKFNPVLSNFYEQKANELLFKAQDSGPASEESITDYYFGGNYG